MRSLYVAVKNGLNIQFHDPRFYILAALIFMFFQPIVSPISQFSSDFQIPASIWGLFPNIFSDFYLSMLLFFGVIVLFCDMPRIDNVQPYLITRIGRNKWIVSQLIDIVITSVLYFLMVFVLTAVCLLPKISFENKWGKIWGTLAQTDAKYVYKVIMPVSYHFQIELKPLNAALITFAICILTSIFMGFLILFCNMMIDRKAGIIASIIVVCLSLFVYYTPYVPFLVRISPITWANLNSTTIIDKAGGVSIPYVFITLSALCTLMVTMVIVAFRKRDIEIIPTR